MYPDDKPFPSVLLFGIWDGHPVHVVAAFDEKQNVTHLITAYRPDAEHFEKDFKTRRIT